MMATKSERPSSTIVFRPSTYSAGDMELLQADDKTARPATDSKNRLTGLNHATKPSRDANYRPNSRTSLLEQRAGKSISVDTHSAATTCRQMVDGLERLPVRSANA